MAPSIIEEEECLVSGENSLDHWDGDIAGMADE
jgi:hypothetical protein